LKISINIILLFSFFLTGCSSEKSSEYPILPYPHVVVWDNKAYVVTDETISKNSLGRQFGEVKRYIDPNKSMPEKNEDSTIAPVGSKLFEINNVDITKSFAVEINGRFRKTIYSEP